MIIEKRADANDFSPVHTQIDNAVIDGQPAMRVVKAEKINDYDENTYAVLNDFAMRNGSIEMRMRSRLLPDAPDFARGFIGVVFRAKADSSEFESFYVRPTNGRSCTDPVRKSHGCQYFSYPGYTFAYFREFGIAEFEAPIDLGLDEWFTLRVEFEDERASLFLNDSEQPALTVPRMKHGAGERGSLGVFVDIGTEAFVSDIKIVSEDD